VTQPSKFGQQGGSASSFPGLNQVSIGGVTFTINTSFEPYRRDAFRHRSIPSQRESVNLTPKTGEGTVNTEGLWRASAFDWSYGAGQLYADREGSVAARFYDSKGVDPFTTQFQVTLLPATKQQLALTDTTINIATIGPVIFYSHSNAVYYTTNYSASTSLLTGLTGAITLSADASNLYISSNAGSSGVWVVNVANGAVGSATQVITDPVDAVFAVSGRVLAASGASVYDITQVINGGGNQHLPNPALITHPSLNWQWVAATGGSSNIYLAGYSQQNTSPVPNTRGAVYRTGINSDGTALVAPVQALPLPANEYPIGLYAYLSYILLATTKGYRFCRTVSANDPSGNTGDLISGPILPNLLHPVTTASAPFTANGRFVYAAYNTFDGTSTGLIRFDLGTLVGDLEPAYCSDLMVTSQATITGLAWDPVTNGPLIALSGAGLYTEDTANLVSQGWVDSGLVTYNIVDDKIACQALIRGSGGGSYTMSLQADGAGYNAATPLSPNSEANPPTFLTTLVRGEEFNVRVFLNSGGANVNETLKRWTLKSLPAVVSGTTISAVLNLYGEIDSSGVGRVLDPYQAYAYLEGLRLQQTPVTYLEGAYSATVVITEIDWLPYKERDTSDFGFIGDLIVYMKTIVG